MTRPRVLLHGPFDVVEIRTGESSRRRDPGVEVLLDAEWNAQLARARAGRTPYADNPAYRLEDAVGDGPRAVLTLATERYRVHAAMKVLHAHPAVTEDHHDRLLVADGLVRTRDGLVVLQRLPKVTGTTTELVGSTCAPHLCAIDSGPDLAGYLAQRVAGALAVDADVVRVGRLLGLVLHEVGCVCAVYAVDLTTTFDEVAAGHPRPEVLVPVPEVALRAWLTAEGGYLPAVADLLPLPGDQPAIG